MSLVEDNFDVFRLFRARERYNSFIIYRISSTRYNNFNTGFHYQCNVKKINIKISKVLANIKKYKQIVQLFN